MPFDIEDLAYPPSGGKVKLILMGLIFPAIISYYGFYAWLDQKAYWPGRHGGGILVHGEAAKAMAIVYLSVATFIHFRWFWGMIQAYRVFQVGIACSILTFAGALLWAFCVA